MATILKDKALWFNDVILVPQIGTVSSRKGVPKEYHRFICSPMTSVVGKTFAKAATDLGLTVCIPRFLGIEKEASVFSECPNKQHLYCSMGLEDLERIKTFSGLGCKNYLIDIAFGNLPQVERTVNLLVDNAPVDNLMIGNVTTKTGYLHLSNILRKYKITNAIIRCGISNGSGCATYDTTGYGSGQVSELIEIAPHKLANVHIASDGGHKNGGTVAKAFMAGADYVLIGGIFAKALEAECHISGDGTYYGLASDKNQILSKGEKTRHSEGKVYEVDRTELKSLKDIVEELWGGISSAVSYSGYSTLLDAVGNGVFQIKENSLPPKKRI